MANEPIIQGPNRLILQDGGRVDRPAFECDVCTARWKCKTTLLASLIPKWGAKHPQYPQLTKVSHTHVSEKGGWTVLDATYRGVIGEMPRVKITDGQSIGSAQLERLSLEGLEELIPATLNIQFYTPTTTYEYYVVKKPKGSIFKHRLNLQDDSFQIIGRRGAGRNRNSVFITAGATVLALMVKGGSDTVLGRKVPVTRDAYNGVAEVVTGNYKSEEVAEGLWRCSETNEIQIFPYGFDSLKRIV